MLDFVFFCTFGAVAAVFAGLFRVRLRRERRRHAFALGAAREMRDTAHDAERVAIRLLRLTSHELRGIGMTLQGHADCFLEPSPASQLSLRAQVDAASLASAAAQVQELADELQDHAFPAMAPRMLREEVVDVAALLAESVASTAALLGPGRRNWRAADASGPMLLWADRRALRHVFARVLTDAARNTGNDDWIDLSVLHHHEGLAVNVQDEGGGFATPVMATLASPGADSRGIGLRLTLARSLMQAHGGRLEVEALAQVGCRVCLIFPAIRLRRHLPD